jgi:U3 small nucleolar RNA-associated protein 25
MQSLAAEKPPQAKRRKLQHSQTDVQIPQGPASPSMINDDADPQEIEEGPETATEGLLEEGEDDDLADELDPFEAHFANPDNNVLSQRLNMIQKGQWTMQKLALPTVGKAIVGRPLVNATELTLETASGPKDLKLKQKLGLVMAKQRSSFDTLEKTLAPMIFNYQDVLFCGRTTKNAGALRRLACLHAVNHIFKFVLLIIILQSGTD